MEQVCVVYLARAKSGIEASDAFFHSYRRFSPGIKHDFVIVAKGFTGAKPIELLLKLANDLKPALVRISDFGFDLRAYRVAATCFENPSFCFLNSFSEILVDDWLAKLYMQIQLPGVGLAGATGSWESMYTNVFIERELGGRSSLLQRVWRPFRLKLCQISFDPVPNYHIRSNGFIINRQVMLSVWPRMILTKRGAYLFENGRRSLTKRIVSLGLRPVVVDRNGGSHAKEAWPKSMTFRQGEQENLMIADNQTRQYAQSDTVKRRFLSRV